MDDKIYLFGFIAFYIIQRLYEVLLNKQNEDVLMEQFGAIEVDPKDSTRMRMLHVFWFIFLCIEVGIHGKFIHGPYALSIILILIMCQLIRAYTIYTLGNLWTIKIYNIPNAPIIKSGPYRYVLHPNYLAVILELLFLPLLLNAWLTMITFSMLNIYVLKKRIALEENELLKNPIYREMKRTNKLFIPFIY